MLLMLTGSSCSGKTTLAFAVAAGGRVPMLAVHDFDEVGVPANPERGWRNRMTEFWVRRALAYQADGVDLLLTGQSPLGELLAAPSAPALNGIAVCLVDVEDEVRRARLTERDAGRWSPKAVDAFLGWAAWHRGHAVDPRHLPEALTEGSWPDMAWHRWSTWTADDRRWHTDLLDTTVDPLAHCVARTEQWIATSRAARSCLSDYGFVESHSDEGR
jgi:hypothetical protein